MTAPHEQGESRVLEGIPEFGWEHRRSGILDASGVLTIPKPQPGARRMEVAVSSA